METKQDASDAKMTSMEALQMDMKKSIDDLPNRLAKTLLTWLLIFTAIIGLFTFLGPSIRKTIGLASNKSETLASSTTNAGNERRQP